MLQFSLLGGGIGQIKPISPTLTPLPIATLIPSAPALAAGTCSADGQFIWRIEGSAGYWARKSPSEPCTTTATIAPTIREGQGGGTTVTDPSGELVETKLTIPGANLQPGTTRMVEVGPFRFSADLPWSTYSWWGRGKLPAEWQTVIKHAWSDSDGTQAPMVPGLAMYFDDPPTTYNNSYVGLGRTSSPKWKPIARSTHPDTGKDYGVFLSITPRYRDKPMNDPTNTMVIEFIWAPIFREWYERIWDWIAKVASRIADYVCSKITDPGLATTTTAAASAGGPIAVGSVTGISLLCQSKTPQTPSTPTDAQPAVQAKLRWPYYLAGGLVLFGLFAFFITSPGKRAA